MSKKSVLLAFALVACCVSLRAQNADGIYTKVDEKPEATKTVAPVAPNGQAGLVAVTCVIDETGRVSNVSVAKSTNAALDKAAMDAVSDWRFKPAKVGGKPVKTKVTVPIRFDDQA